MGFSPLHGSLKRIQGFTRQRDLSPNEVDAKVDRPIEERHRAELQELMTQVQRAKVDGLARAEIAEDQRIIKHILDDIDAVYHMGSAAGEGMQNWMGPFLSGLKTALTELNERIGEKAEGVDLSREDER